MMPARHPASAPARHALAPPCAALAPGQPPSTLLEALDRVLETGVVADGQIAISLAGVDLVFIGLRALVASVETAARLGARP